MVDWNEISKATKDAREQGPDGAAERMRERHMSENPPSATPERIARGAERVGDFGLRVTLIVTVPIIGLVVGGWVGLIIALVVSSVLLKALSR